MPASPVTKPTQRSPRRACASQPCNVPSSASRPTAAPGGTAAGAGAAGRPGAGPGSGRASGPMKRYPRRCTVSTYCGVRAVSPSACRILRIHTTRAASLTTVSGQAVSNNASFVTNWPARSMSTASTAQAWGVRRIASAPRHRQALVASSRTAAGLSCMGRSLGRFRHGDAVRTCLELGHVSLMTSPPPRTYIHAIRNGSTAQAYHAEEGR
jgi:hypothetical protein